MPIIIVSWNACNQVNDLHGLNTIIHWWQQKDTQIPIMTSTFNGVSQSPRPASYPIKEIRIDTNILSYKEGGMEMTINLTSIQLDTNNNLLILDGKDNRIQFEY